MKSTRWIAVAGWLIGSPVLGQFEALPAVPEPSDASVSGDAVKTEAPAASFETELEQLRHDLAAIKTLREQAATEVGQPISTDSQATQRERRELMDLLTKLATKRVTPKLVPVAPEPLAPPVAPPELKHDFTRSVAKASEPHPLVTDKVLDPFALGRALFKAGDYVGAEQAFRKAKVNDDNRVMLQYLIATCLRKQQQWEQAAKAYRVVAENKDDAALRDLAVWQMDNIRWYQQTEAQIEQLRQLREPPADAPEVVPPASEAAISLKRRR